MNSYDRRVVLLMEEGDLNGLVRLLRNRDDARLRAEAARALAEVGDVQAAEALTVSALYDPDAKVKETSRQALHDLIGFQAKIILGLVWAAGPPPEPWLIEAEPERVLEGTDQALDEIDLEDPQADWGLSAADRESLRGLIQVVQTEPDRRLRLRAVQALGRTNDMSALRTLAEVSLYDHDPELRSAASAVLQATFGDELPGFLRAVREEYEGPEEEEEEEEDLAAEAGGRLSPYNTPTSGSWAMPPNSSVIQEERAPVWIWIVIALVVILGGVWFFFLR